MPQSNDFVIQTHGLSKSYGEVQALKRVDLNVPRNSIFGFLGPNGAGKTTLMKVLLGLNPPSGGNGTIFGHDIVSESVAIRERIGYLPQQPRFIEHMTARQNLLFTARFFFRGPEAKIRQRCDHMLELVGLAEKADRPIKGFSGGEKQRLGIALAQVNYPDLLILDEPASALDPMGRMAVLEIMERLREHTTVFYSTHILDDVQRVSDTVAILNNGMLVAQGPISHLLSGKDGIVYSLVTKGDTENLPNRLDDLSWITNVTATKRNGTTHWQISISDEDAAENELLRYVLSDPQVIVTAFSRKQYELEEIFMNIVKGDGHDH
ncbi:MAG: ABC transporter ATP-binding protein [Anaerolineales bacterium]|nr:ABC transporter ATP-binding protein [Anaerolineales bacterium]